MSSKKSNRKNLIILVFIILGIAVISIVAGWYLSDRNTDKPISEKNRQTNQTTSEKPADIKTPIEGTWASKYDGAMLSITGLSFSLDLASVDKSVTIKGTILVKDDLVTFINKNGICKDVQGQYKFSLKNGELSFKPVSDECSSRKERMTAGWFGV